MTFYEVCLLFIMYTCGLMLISFSFYAKYNFYEKPIRIMYFICGIILVAFSLKISTNGTKDSYIQKINSSIEKCEESLPRNINCKIIITAEPVYYNKK